ncbi:ABC transporter permease [Variovorax ginsengisoli]|uniref:MlaE family lipid ABC transporter permease subunit n=1 Tax=Variovorax ginsengisoli TaxID=363844 RepID=A0ABT8SGK8_9BURK|nr:MlaE family lipid ABC transporter permease subunit [Variovorax ginsengisoli]MDN8618849.1 MlaE family lipid ABC transporter permease subunit [Variovorax ginsengisoli]MDO1538019.1 MlaE family lipid ABC transporter permease subunit [Variovorax ginsengisoli]
MHTSTDPPQASMAPLTTGGWSLAGSWTARGLGDMPRALDAHACGPGPVVLDGASLAAIDSAGVWVLQRWLRRHGAAAALRNWPPRMQTLMTLVGEQPDQPLPQPPGASPLERVGRHAEAAAQQALGLLRFVGQAGVAALALLARPRRIRWRTVLRNMQIDGFDALPIIGLTSFLLGVVVAYQGADQLKHYGANVFVVDLVGYAMLREFAPLISAIIIAGRSGSAYSAQIGTMVVTEEIDAMQTLAIDPIELLVLPKVLALGIALPLLTVFADLTGVLGGMVMARVQLDIGFPEFIDRFGREMHGSTLLVGVGKSLVFAVVIAMIGCFQGFRTRGSADSVGRQTTKSVVQSIFLVIVADALFSVAFNMLDL